MTDEQKKKIIELRKLGIGYRSIATAMESTRLVIRFAVLYKTNVIPHLECVVKLER